MDCPLGRIKAEISNAFFSALRACQCKDCQECLTVAEMAGVVDSTYQLVNSGWPCPHVEPEAD